MWIALSIISALCESTKDAFGKISSVKNDEYTSAVWLHLFTLLIMTPVVLFSKFPTITNDFWVGSIAFVYLTPLWSILYMKALKLSPLSTSLPMMAFNPIFTGLLAFIFKGELPTVLGWMGIILISSGLYFINLKKSLSSKNLLHPFEVMFSDKGAQAMLGVAFIWSLGAFFSKMRVDGSSAVLSTFSGGVIGVVTTYLIAKYKGKTVFRGNFLSNFKSQFMVGFFYFLATIISSFALVQGSAPYVFSLKRSSVIFSSFIGKLFFKETLGVVKILGLILILLGMFFIVI